MLTPVAVASQECVWGRSIVGIAGSNAAEGMDVRDLYLLCVVSVAVSATGWSLVQITRPGVLPGVFV